MSLSCAWAWQDLAACRGKPLALFFGTESEQYDRAAKERRENKARAVCASCPVAEHCREYALGRPEKHGTWGGMTAEERHAERRRRARRAAAAGKREAAA